MSVLRPYLTAFRIRAKLEGRYRGAALGGIITQGFFGVVLCYLYIALWGARDAAALKATVTYVWIQQIFFRALLSAESELTEQIRTGSIAYAVLRPVDLHAFWFCRTLAQSSVGVAMRMIPTVLLQLILPRELKMTGPESAAALLQFLLSLALGFGCIAQIRLLCMAVMMKWLDGRGIVAMINLSMMFLCGNIIPLTLFPDSLQALIRFQPFAQLLDAPIRAYLHAMEAGEFLLHLSVQAGWFLLLTLFSRRLWCRNLRLLTVQGG